MLDSPEMRRQISRTYASRARYESCGDRGDVASLLRLCVTARLVMMRRNLSVTSSPYSQKLSAWAWEELVGPVTFL